MPFWLTIAWEMLKALVAGNFKDLWQEHQAKEADDAKNKAESLSDTAAVDELRAKWTRD